MPFLIVALLLLILSSNFCSSSSQDRRKKSSDEKYVIIDEIPEPSNVQRLQINKMDEIKLELDLSDSNVFNKTITDDIFVNIKHNSTQLCENRLKDIVSSSFDCAISINNFKENRKNILILTIYSHSDVLVVYDIMMLTFYYNKETDQMLYSQRHLSNFERNLISINGYNKKLRRELLVLFGLGTYFLFVMKPVVNRQKDIKDILDILLANSTDSGTGGDGNDNSDEFWRVPIANQATSSKIFSPLGVASLGLNIGLGLLLGLLLGRSGKSDSRSSIIINGEFPPIDTSPLPGKAGVKNGAGLGLQGLLQRVFSAARPFLKRSRSFIRHTIHNLPPVPSIPGRDQIEI